MNLSELCKSAGLYCDEKFSGIEITRIVSNSEAVCRGDLFVCIKGLSHDGHLHIGEAIEKGAVALLCMSGEAIEAIRGDVAVIYADDTRRAMAYLYSAWYGHPQNYMKIIGVTGTNGKTTVSRMIYEILRCSGESVGVIGTLGAECCGSVIDISSDNELSNMTTPDPEQLYEILAVMRERGVEFVVMEVSSHALTFSRVAPIKFKFGIFTNLTPEHLDLHGNMEEYFLAKSILFEQCERAIINCDGVYGKRLLSKYSDISTGCSTRGDGVSVCAEQIITSERGISYKICHPKMRARITCNIPGEFTVANSLLAVICSYELGISVSDIKIALAGLSGIDGRLERVRIDCDFSVFIDYAHTPDALENLLRTAREFSGGKRRIVLLFGCGGDRDVSKRAKMGRIASTMADFVIITSDNSRGEEKSDIIGEILRGVDKDACFTVIEDRESAIEYAIKNARKNDVILLAGKGHEKYEIDKGGRRYFCERDIVKKYVSKYHSVDV